MTMSAFDFPGCLTTSELSFHADTSEEAEVKSNSDCSEVEAMAKGNKNL